MDEALSQDNYLKLLKSQELYLLSRRKKLEQILFAHLKKSMAQGIDHGTSDLNILFADFENTFSQVQDYKINCIIDCARTLVNNHLAINPQGVVAIAIKVLKNIAEHTDVEILANNQDAEILEASLPEIALACTSARKVSVAKDKSMTTGSIVVKANKSIIDANLDTQLARARDIFTL